MLLLLMAFSFHSSSASKNNAKHSKNGFLQSMDFDWAREKGFTGRDIKVAILDSFIWNSHPDLVDSMDTDLSRFSNKSNSEKFHYGIINHGTNVAGILASKGTLCDPGLAPDAKIVFLQTEFEVRTLDRKESRLISYENDKIDIYILSFGPNDDGKTVSGPGRLTKEALMNAVLEGRNKKGNIFIVASGNGGINSDDCNCDSYVSSPYTVGVHSDQNGPELLPFQEHCSAQMFSISDLSEEFKTTTTTTSDNELCKFGFSGTSSAPPVIAASIALLLESFPDLTWRDVLHIMVESSSLPPNKTSGILINAAGYTVSHYLGFGTPSVSKMFSLAATWSMVPLKQTCQFPVSEIYKKKDIGGLELIFNDKKCKIKHIEFVYFEFSANVKGQRGFLSIQITSPSQTKSLILSERSRDFGTNIFKNVQMKSVHFWGEKSSGNWQVEMYNKEFSKAGKIGVKLDLEQASLVIEGY